MTSIHNEQSYVPGTHYHWKGRDDGPGAPRFHNNIVKVDLRDGLPKTSTEKTFALVGFASDDGVKRNLGRPGAVKGPQHLREALAKLPYSLGEGASILDVGDVCCVHGNLEKAQETLGQVIKLIIDEGMIPIAMGGGHEISFGSYKGFKGAHPKRPLAIVNFDAHYDLRPLVDETQGTSGTGFTQIYDDLTSQQLPFHYVCAGVQRYGNTKDLFAKAEELNVQTIYAEDIQIKGYEALRETLEQTIGSHEHIYVSICLDVFHHSCAPGVSAPQPLGLMPWHILESLRRLASSGKVACFDIAELSPPYDINNITSSLAASLICDYIHNYR